MSTEELRGRVMGASALLRNAEWQYELKKTELEPQIESLSARADALAIEFKSLVVQASDAYRRGEKALAGLLAQERRAKQAECEQLNAQANQLRQILASELQTLVSLRQRHQELNRELRAKAARQKKLKQARMRLRAAKMKLIPFANFNDETIPVETAWGALSFFPSQALEWVDSVAYFPEHPSNPLVRGAAAVPDDERRNIRVRVYGPPFLRPGEDRASAAYTTLIHEMAHVVYYRVLSAEGRAEWGQLCYLSYEQGEISTTEYGSTHPKEEFAEFYLRYLIHGKVLQPLVPGRYNFIDGLVERLEADEMADYLQHKGH